MESKPFSVLFTVAEEYCWTVAQAELTNQQSLAEQQVAIDEQLERERKEELDKWQP